MVLIVDDRPENILPLKKILELNQFEVDTATSGEEALKKVLKNDYSLVLLDVQMPGMDGFEVAEALSGSSKTKDLPIVFLSAVNKDKSFIAKGFNSGAVDYITKPVDTDVLILKVKTFHRLFEQNKKLKELSNNLKNEVEYRKQAQTELKETIAQLNSTFESLPQIAIILSPNGEIIYANNNWFGYALTIDEFPEIHPDDKDETNKQWMEGLESGEAFEFETRLKKISANSFKFHLLRAVPVKEKRKIIKWIATFTDIDEGKRIEKRKEEFVGIASHELKTPLTTIKAYFQLLERAVEGRQDASDLQTYILKGNEQLDKLTGLIADLLDISKIESGKMKFSKSEFSFNKLLEKVVETMQQINQEYKVIIEKNEQVKVYADQNRIEQVLINYISNAIKYSPNVKEVVVLTEVKGKDLLIKVKDHGVGIAKEKQSNIFHKFFRAEESAERFQGLGLGLYICSQIISRHGGSFGVESEPGKGSEFYFTLPIKAKK